MATTVSRTGCEITVELSIEFQNSTDRLNDTEFRELIDSWEESIEDLWNGSSGSQRYRCCTVRFDVVTRIGQGTDGFHQITVVQGPQTSTAGIGPGSVGGTWDDQDTGNVVAHEAGHVMCLGDEYDYNGPDGSYRNLNPQPDGQPESIMAQTWGDVAALQEHIAGIMDCVDARCPWWCCILPIRMIPVRLLRIPRDLLKSLRGELQPSEPPQPREAESMTTKSVDELLQDVRSGEPDRISTAYRELQALDEEMVPTLREALNDENSLVRWAAAGVLGDVGDSKAESDLEERLNDPNRSVRVKAAHSLGKLGNTEGIPVLIEALEYDDDVMIGHPPELVSDYAAQALKALTGENFGGVPSTTAEGPSDSVQRWEAWWDEHEESFTSEFTGE